MYFILFLLLTLFHDLIYNNHLLFELPQLFLYKFRNEKNNNYHNFINFINDWKQSTKPFICDLQ